MRVYQTIAILFICFSLFAGGMANTAMACCMQPSSVEQMQVDKANVDIPCHKEASKKDDKTQKSCEQCRACLGANAVISQNIPYSIAFVAIAHDESITGFTSLDPDGIYSPPKAIF